MNDLDTLIDALVSDAQIRSGTPIEWLQARDFVARSVPAQEPIRAPRWTKAEDEFYLEHVGSLSYDDIAAALGRSAEGLKIHAKRRGLPLATRVPGWLTAHQVGVILGVDTHKVPNWIDAGIMPGETIPFNGRPVRRVRWTAFKRWLVKPESWIYFDSERIQNESLSRLGHLAKQRWGDEWWTARRAADYLHCDPTDIARQIKLGKLPAIQSKGRSGRHPDQYWAFWYARRSDVEKLVINRRKGAPGASRLEWNPRADEFILKCLAEGKLCPVIARMMKQPVARIRYRAAILKKRGL